MGISTGLFVYARNRDGPHRAHDRKQAAAILCRSRSVVCFCLALTAATSASPDTIRVATFNAELTRDGPGILLRDILAETAEVLAAAQLIRLADPDLVLLTGFDHDAGLIAAKAFGKLTRDGGGAYPHLAALSNNRGTPSGADRDGNGRVTDAEDMHGFATFPGQSAMVLLSRFPIVSTEDWTQTLWKDVPESLAQADDPGFQSLRLSTVGHWSLTCDVPTMGKVDLLAWFATPPVFDGPSDINGRRNRDESRFWLHHLAKVEGDRPFILLGDANADPNDGEALAGGLDALLAHPKVQDPRPQSKEGLSRSLSQGGQNRSHKGDPRRDTADWPDGAGGPGNLRVDYVLPSADWTIVASGVIWSPNTAIRHGLVWVDLSLGN